MDAKRGRLMICADRFAGKTAIVTGGASGIGLAMVMRLVEEGANVVVADLSGAESEVASRLGASAFHGDVSDAAAVQAMVDLALERYGALHVLLANAGIDGEIAPLIESSLENFDRLMANNARSVFLAVRTAIPAMHGSCGGSIVATASAAGLVAAGGLAAYGASKSAVIGFTRTAAVEAAPLGVRVNCICPGVVDTPMARSAPQEMFDRIVAQHPIGRLASVEEIASAGLYLASDDASFITGSALVADGGFTIA